MRKKGILLAMLILALTMTVAIATAETVERGYVHTHPENDQTASEAHDTDADNPANISSVRGVSYAARTTSMVAVSSVTVSGDLKVGSALTATIDAIGATAYSFWVYDAHNNLVQAAYMTASNTLTFSAPRPGGYNVHVAATNGKLTASGHSGWFIVTGDQVTISSLVVSGTQIVGSPITATVISPNATAYSYWLYDGNAALVEEVYMTSSNTYTFTPQKPGIYNVFVAVTDGASGISANTGWFPVKGDPVIIHNLTISGEKKAGSPLTATIDATGATGYSFWVYDANGTLVREAYMVTTNSLTFTPATAGGYNVFVAVTDGVSGAQTNSGWFDVE